MPRTRMDDLVEELEQTEDITEPVSGETKKAKRKFQQTDLILCKSVTNGGLFLEGSKTAALSVE